MFIYFFMLNRNLGFEVYSKQGISSGVLMCETFKKKTEIVKNIKNNIKTVNCEYVSWLPHTYN